MNDSMSLPPDGIGTDSDSRHKKVYTHLDTIGPHEACVSQEIARWDSSPWSTGSTLASLSYQQPSQYRHGQTNEAPTLPQFSSPYDNGRLFVDAYQGGLVLDASINLEQDVWLPADRPTVGGDILDQSWSFIDDDQLFPASNVPAMSTFSDTWPGLDATYDLQDFRDISASRNGRDCQSSQAHSAIAAYLDTHVSDTADGLVVGFRAPTNEGAVWSQSEPILLPRPSAPYVRSLDGLSEQGFGNGHIRSHYGDSVVESDYYHDNAPTSHEGLRVDAGHHLQTQRPPSREYFLKIQKSSRPDLYGAGSTPKRRHSTSIGTALPLPRDSLSPLPSTSPLSLPLSPQLVQRSLDTRTKRVRDTKWAFQCLLCSMVLSDAKGANRHFASLHTDARPFVCGLCGKAYKRQDHQTRHTSRCTGPPKSTAWK